MVLNQTKELSFDFALMTSKDKKKIFEQNTTELRSIIKQADSSGKAAWIAGKMLRQIKEAGLYKIKYKTYAKYLDIEFRMTELTANTYIKIHECFNIDEIGDLIVSNLRVIADIQNDNVSVPKIRTV